MKREEKLMDEMILTCPDGIVNRCHFIMSYESWVRLGMCEQYKRYKGVVDKRLSKRLH